MENRDKSSQKKAGAGMNKNLGAMPLSVDILEKANIGLWAFELDEGCEPRMYVDNVMLGLIGLTEQTTPEKTYHAWYDNIDPEHYDEVSESVEKMISGVHSEVQYPWHHPDGRIMTVRCGGVRNPAYTKGIRIEGTHMDVTEVLHVEKNKDTLLDGLSREYHTVWLMDGFGDHKVHLYRSTGKTTVQSAVKLGLDEPCYDSSVVKYIMNSVHEDDRERMLEATKFETVERETPDVGTYVVTYKRYNDQGTVDYHQMCFAKAVSPDGGTNYIMAYRDADRTMRDQLAMTEEMKRNSSLINILTDDYLSVFAVDYETDEYTVISRENSDSSAKDHQNTSDAAADMQKYIMRFVHPDDRDMLSKAIEYNNIRENLAHANRYRVTFRTNAGGGDYKYIDFVAGKEGDPDSPVTSVAMGFQDVDERVRKEKEYQNNLERALEEAQYANRAKTAFLNSMSHDIRTPLNAIKGYTAMAKKHMDKSGEAYDYLNKIDVSGHQLLELINQVLEMSRIESGKVVLQQEPADVIDRAYDMKTLSGTDIENKNLKYTVIIKDVPHRYVLADGSRMNQIILNVIGNAIKYTPEGGSIEYTVEEKPCEKEGYGLYSFTVADTGIGMSEEYQKHIFEEFTRENTSTVSHIQGTGLGMPIVKKLVDLMGGSIDVKSKLGEGTTITVNVPMKWDTHTENRAIETAKYLNLDFKGKRLLLVEDNEMNREIALDILQDAGFIVDTAEDGDIAVEKMKEYIAKGQPYYFDAVLMDIQMPRMNGYEATKAIRALPDPQNTHLPIIALSANAFEEDRQKSLEAGMDDHLSKPIDVKKLKETLARYL